MRVGRAVAAVAVVGAVISGCGGPEQPGTAFAIGDRVISLNQVEAAVDVALADPNQVAAIRAIGGDQAALAREVVTASISGEIVTGPAAAAGVVVNPADAERIASSNANGFLDYLAQAQPGLPVDDPGFRGGVLAQTRRIAPVQIAAIGLGRAVVGRVSIVVDEITVRDRATAEKTARTVAAGGAAADAALAGQGAKRGVTYDAANPGYGDRAGTVVFGVPQGAVVAYQPNPDNAMWSVARVVSRRTDGPLDTALRDQLSQLQLAQIGQRVAQADAASTPVVVNPRFGTWDPVGFGLTTAGETSGLVILPD